MEQGSAVAAIAAMAFVLVGVFQFLSGYIKSTNKDYLALREKYEALQSKNVQLETNNLYWKNKALLTAKANRRLTNQLAQCSETIQAALNKTQPLPDFSQPKVDDTIVPE
jgi:hypothetical protein